jgi:hypothetical protein
MNKRTKIILLTVGLIGISVGGYFLFRYLKRQADKKKAKDDVENLRSKQVPVFKESNVSVKNVWRPSKPSISVMNNFDGDYSNAAGSFFNTNKTTYEKTYTTSPLENALLIANKFK